MFTGDTQVSLGNAYVYDKVYGYYSMWNVRNDMNQRNIEVMHDISSKLTKITYSFYIIFSGNELVNNHYIQNVYVSTLS